jgi:hypothetical protein
LTLSCISSISEALNTIDALLDAASFSNREASPPFVILKENSMTCPVALYGENKKSARYVGHDLIRNEFEIWKFRFCKKWSLSTLLTPLSLNKN